MSRIFLSHSSANNAQAIVLRDWLIGQGWDELFLDLDPQRGLKAGERWQAALKQAAERCELVIVLVSPVWAASRWCLAEFLLATNLNKRIFGVIVEPTPLTDLPTELTAEWQLVDLTAGAPAPAQPGAVSFGADGLNRLRIGLMQTGLDPRYFAWPPAHDPERAPFRGLLPLDADDAGIFFGRDGPIVLALDQLRGLRDGPAPRLLVILGASGAGKSSFMRAGLLPRLTREDSHFLALPVLRPERAAISGEAGLVAGLEQALKAAGLARSRAKVRAAVDQGAVGVAALLAELVEAQARRLQPEALDASAAAPESVATAPKPPTLVLPIDQAEELFATNERDEGAALLDLLSALAQHDAPALILMFTIRSDQYERLQTAPALAGLRQHTLSLAPMPRGAYVDVIKGPARQLDGSARALKIDEPLVDALLADIEAGGAKDALPLLAFTLERLYTEHGGDGRLSLAGYVDLGRVQGAIEAAVDRALRAADQRADIPKDPQARRTLLRRGLIPWLAGIDAATGAPKRSVARLSEIPAEARPLLDLLVDQRLLATDVAAHNGEATVEPAHEALLRQWGLLRGWLVEDSGLLAVLEGTKRAARDWAANQRHADWLAHTSHRLADAERLRARPDLASNLEPTDRDYLSACTAAQRAARRQVQRTRATFAGLVGVLTLAGLGWWQQDALAAHYVARVVMRVSALSASAEQAIARQPQAEFSECAHGCPRMVVLPAGEFSMGASHGAGAGLNDELQDSPPHRVRFAKPFAVAKTELSFVQWRQCVHAGACDDIAHAVGTLGDDRPVGGVSWPQAQAYVHWLARMTGRPYRLLSEAEWEYAARAGSSTRYAFGDDEAQLPDHAWYRANAGKVPMPVATKPANAWGLHDLHGNLAEWLEDGFHPNYDGAPSDGSAWLQGGAPTRRMIRGGSYKDGPATLRASQRLGGTDDGRSYAHVGFRVARTLSP